MSFLPFEDDPSVYLEEEAPTPVYKEEKKTLTQIIEEEKERADYTHRASPRFKPARDVALDSLYRRDGGFRGFREGTPEDKEKFADWLVDDIQSGGYSSTSLDPAASDIFRYEAVRRYGAKVPERTEKAHLYHGALRRGKEDARKRKAQTETLTTAITEIAGGLGPATLLRVGVTDSGEKGDEIPDWKGDSKKAGSIREQMGALYAGTMAGNTAGVKFDPRALKHRGLIESLSDADVDPEDRDDLRKLKAGYKASGRQTLTSIDWGETVAPESLVVFQTQLENGQFAVDEGLEKAKYKQAARAVLAQRAGYASIPALLQKGSKEEIARISADAERQAEADINQLKRQSLDSVLFLTDPRKFAKELRLGKDPLALVSGALTLGKMLKAVGVIDEEQYEDIAQFRAPWMRLVYPQSDEQYGVGALHYARTVEQMGSGKLDQFFNFGAWSPIFSWLLDPDEDMEWGSEDHLTKMGRDYNIFDDVGAIGEAVKEFFGADWGEVGTRRAGFSTALFMTLAEPDMFMAMAFGPKLVAAPIKAALKGYAKVGDIADLGDVYRVRRAKKELASVMAAWDKTPPTTVDEAIGIVRLLKKAGFEQTAQTVQSHVAARLGMRAGSRFDIGPELRGLAGAADKTVGNAPDVASIVHSVIKKSGIKLAGKQQTTTMVGALVSYMAKTMKVGEASENLRRVVAVTGATEKSTKKIAKAVTKTRKAMSDRSRLVGRAKAIRQKLANPNITPKLEKSLTKSLKTAEDAAAKLSHTIRPGLLQAPVWAAVKDYEVAKAMAASEGAVLGKILGSSALGMLKESAEDIVSVARIAQRTSPKSIKAIRDALEEAHLSLGKFEEFLQKPPGLRKETAGYGGVSDFLRVGNNNKILLDANKWLGDLRTRFGGALVDDMLDAMRVNPAQNVLRRRLDEDVLEMTRAEINVLNQAGSMVAQRAFQTVDEPLNQARAIIHAWREDLVGKGLRNLSPSEWGAYLAQRIANVGSKFDAARSRQGEWRENVQELSKQASVRGAESEAEAIEYLVANGADEWGKFPTLIYQMLDTTQNLNTGTRIAALNKQNGMTVYQNFKNYILGVTSGLSGDALQKVLSENAAFQAAIRAYLPKSIRTRAEEVGHISATMLPVLIKSRSANEFADGLKARTLQAYGGSVASESVRPMVSKGTYKGVAQKDDYFPDHIALSMMARGMLHGQNWKLTNDNLARALGPAMTPEQALKANFIVGQARSKPGDSAFDVLLTAGSSGGFDPTGAFDAIHRWGMTFNKDTMANVTGLMNDAATIQKQMVRVGANATTGLAEFAPLPFVRQIDDKLRSAIKVLDATPTTGFDAYNKGAVQKYLRYWRTSVTRGLIFPRPAYLMNQWGGDFGQMLMPEGLLSLRRQQVGKNKGSMYLSGALPMSLQNAFTYVPFIGPKMTAVLEDLGETAAKAGVPSLTTPLNALVNPFVQRILTGKYPDELYRVTDDLLRSDDLIAEMQRNGVFDAMFNDDLRKFAGKWSKNLKPDTWDAQFSSVKKAAQAWQRVMNDLIHQTQNHQRAALYLEHRLRRGATAKEATKAVQRALYDWSNGVTKWEMEKLATVASFYPYTRLAAQQMGNALLEPLTFSLKDTAKNAILGTTQLNRTRKLGQVVTEGIPSWVDWEEGQGELSYAEAVQHVNRNTYTWWAGGRPHLASGTISPEAQERMRGQTGRLDTTWHRIGPSFGTPETMEIYLTLINAAVGTVASTLGSEHFMVGADARDEVLDELLFDQLNPPYRAVVKGAYDNYTERGGFHYRHPSGGRRVRISLQEMTKVANKFPIVQEWITEDEHGYYLPAWMQEVILATPIVGGELPNLLRPFYGYQPEFEEGTAKGIAYMMADFAGLARLYTSNPGVSRDIVAKRIARDIQAAVQAKEKQAASRGGPGADLKEYE